MQGVEVIEQFEQPLELAPVTETGAYMPTPPRNRDPRVQMRGTVHYPLTERVASDLRLHGEEWTRAYCRERGLDGVQLEVIVAGAKRFNESVSA